MNKRPMFGPIWIVAYVLFFITGLVMCCYGYAAVNSAVYISGEATVKATGDFGIDYMQDMTPEVCARVPVETTKQLIDKRDGKSYWIAKMADDRCWMTQNLALDLTTEGLTSELSDLQPDTRATDRSGYSTTVNEDGETIYHWDANSKAIPRATVIGAPFTSSSSTANNRAAKSSNPGNYIIAKPTVVAPSNETVGAMSDVVGVELIDVTGWEPTYKYDPDVGLSYDAENKTYDAHYLIGNYYSHGAANAGSSPATAHTFGLSSICPKGWRLPHQNSSGGGCSENREFACLANAYNTGTKTTYVVNGASRDIAEPPLYLFRAGFNGSKTNFARVGREAGWWSYYSNAANYSVAMNIVNLTFNHTAAERGTYGGYSVRCVAW